MKAHLNPISEAVCKHISRTWIVVLLLLLVPSVSVVGAETTLKKVSLAPQWIPQAQFAGYMVALEKGFYRDVGLDLTLLVGGPGKSPFVMLESGQATFCTDWLSNGIEKKASGLGIVNLAQISQRSALILVAKKKSGIEQPQRPERQERGSLGRAVRTATQGFLPEVWAESKHYSKLFLYQPLSQRRGRCHGSHVVQRVPHYSQQRVKC